MRPLFLSVMMMVGCATMASEPSRLYLNSLNAYTLGYPHVEFYEAFIVSNNQNIESDTLLRDVQLLCSEFPKLDTYQVRVFTDSRWANQQTFSWSMGPKNKPDRMKLAGVYVAEIDPEGRMILYPYSDSPKAVKIKLGWCNSK